MRNAMSIACPVVGPIVLVLTLASPALAQTPVLVDLVGPVTIDGRYLGDIDLKVADDGEGGGEVDVVRLATLLDPLLSPEARGLFADLGKRDRFQPFTAVSVGGVTVRYDPARLGLALTVPTAGRPRTTLSLGGPDVPRLDDYARPADIAAGVQLMGRKAFSYEGEPFRTNLTGRAEGFMTIGGFEGVTLSSAFDYRSGAPDAFLIDDATLTHDNFDTAVRYQAGTTLPQPTGLQNATILRGVGIARRYQAIRPFQNIRPTGRQSVLVERPSTAEIFVNGVLVTRTVLAPGPYDLDDLPLVQGGNNVRLVIQDSTGATETIDRSTFFSPVVLAPGLTDFGAWAGIPDSTLPSGRRPFVGTGYYARGVERGTLGVNGQASPRGLQLGGSAIRAFQLGFVAFDVAWGKGFDGPAGWAAALDVQLNVAVRQPDDFTVQARAEVRGGAFYSPVDDAYLNPSRLRAAATASYRLDAVTAVSAGGSYVRSQVGNLVQWSANAGLLRQFGRINASAFFQRDRLEDGRTSMSVRVGVTAALGPSVTLTGRAESRSGRTEADLSRFRRSIGPDWAGRLTVGREAGQTDALGQLQWFGQRAFAGVTHLGNFAGPQSNDDGQRTVVDAGSFIGFADGDIGWGREGNEGFSLVRTHPSLSRSDVQIRHYGQTMYRNDGLGPIVLPFQRSYTAVPQEYLVDRMPEGYALPSTQQALFPGFRAGYRFTIGSDAYLSVQGVLLARGGRPAALRIGQLRPVTPRVATVDFFTAEDGSFFAQGLAKGEYDVVIDKAVVGRFKVAPGADLLVQVGEVKTNAP